MSKCITTSLINIEKEKENNMQIYILTNIDIPKSQHKIIFKNNTIQTYNHIQFKIYTILIESIEFITYNKTRKYTSIHSDGFLFSFVMKNLDDYCIIKINPLNSTNLTNPKIIIKKIMMEQYDFNKLQKIYWDNIFIINLTRRSDRKKEMIKKLQKANINKYEFIEAIDGNDLNIIDMYNNYKKNYKSYIITCGHFSCLLSHIKTIKLAQQLKYSSIMILEDDVIFCDNFIKQLELLQIPSYDMIYLGGIISKKKIFFNKWAKSNKIMGAYSYIITSNLYTIVLKELEKLIEYVDLFYMKKIQPNYKIILLEDFIKTNLDSSDTSAKTLIMTQRLGYIK